MNRTGLAGQMEKIEKFYVKKVRLYSNKKMKLYKGFTQIKSNNENGYLVKDFFQNVPLEETHRACNQGFQITNVSRDCTEKNETGFKLQY